MKGFVKFWLKHGNWVLEWVLMPGIMVFFVGLLYCLAIPEGRWAVVLLAEMFLAIWGIGAISAKGLRPAFVVTALLWLAMVILERAYFWEIALWTVKGIGLLAVFLVGAILFSNFVELVVTELSKITEEARAELEEETEAEQE